VVLLGDYYIYYFFDFRLWVSHESSSNARHYLIYIILQTIPRISSWRKKFCFWLHYCFTVTIDLILTEFLHWGRNSCWFEGYYYFRSDRWQAQQTKKKYTYTYKHLVTSARLGIACIVFRNAFRELCCQISQFSLQKCVYVFVFLFWDSVYDTVKAGQPKAEPVSTTAIKRGRERGWWI